MTRDFTLQELAILHHALSNLHQPAVVPVTDMVTCVQAYNLVQEKIQEARTPKLAELPPPVDPPKGKGEETKAPARRKPRRKKAAPKAEGEAPST